MQIPWDIVIIAFLIFCSRIIDVTIGTIRIIYISRGQKAITALLGFFEALLWLVVISQVIQNLTNVVYYFAYAGGFAVGNFMGVLLVEKFAENIVLIRIIATKKVKELIAALKDCQVGITEVQGQGIDQEVSIIFTVINKVHEKRVIKIIQDINPKAFYTIEGVHTVNKGFFPHRRDSLSESYIALLNKRKLFK
ncbi:MAG: DUF5698 domain-containing protein [Candidatus Margulisbacteria bacterium]|nr:DUF5698 domain-containing protein [Candidatus Margulisiibacteriota bacterium]